MFFAIDPKMNSLVHSQTSDMETLNKDELYKYTTKLAVVYMCIYVYIPYIDLFSERFWHFHYIIVLKTVCNAAIKSNLI